MDLNGAMIIPQYCIFCMEWVDDECWFFNGWMDWSWKQPKRLMFWTLQSADPLQIHGFLFKLQLLWVNLLWTSRGASRQVQPQCTGSWGFLGHPWRKRIWSKDMPSCGWSFSTKWVKQWDPLSPILPWMGGINYQHVGGLFLLYQQCSLIIHHQYEATRPSSSRAVRHRTPP